MPLGFSMWENGAMEPVSQKGPSPWLSPILMLVALLAAVLWAYIQMDQPLALWMLLNG